MFEPQNDLEKSLVRASEEVDHRPTFIQDLLNSQIYIINALGDQAEAIDGAVEPGTDIQIQAWQRADGQDLLPVFTSLEQLRQHVDSELTYFRMQGRDFFEMVIGAHVVLNPNSELGIALTSDEIAAILDGTYVVSAAAYESVTYESKKPVEVTLGQPEVYPVKLIEALSQLFEQQGGITASYVASMQDEARDSKPNLLIGIDTELPWAPLMETVGRVTAEAGTPGEAIDFVRISHENEGLSEYLLEETEPFYTS